ncbi:MAG: redoxin domain-containing protein [Candidatus Micrarchaeota archaeon]|nr:redoxin domain-containing protein [Candidatus Micrarchaeota archaeon]
MVEIGDSVPKLKLVDTELKPIELSKAAAGKPTVIAFFPGAFTGVCTKEMCTFRDGISRLNGMNASIYAISVDGPFSNKAFKEKNGLNFTVLSDYKKKGIKLFDIVQKDFAHVRGYTAAKRSIFIADSTGKIRYKWVSDDPGVEPNYEEVMSALKSIS